MSNVLNQQLGDDLEIAVSEYRGAEKMVQENFIKGILHLGKILREQRDIWKPEQRWVEFLEKVGKSLAGANQFIRLYEYSIKNLKDIQKAQLTNWEKVNLFLSVPEDMREKFAEAIANGEITASEDFALAAKQAKETDLSDEIILEKISPDEMNQKDIKSFKNRLDTMLENEVLERQLDSIINSRVRKEIGSVQFSKELKPYIEIAVLIDIASKKIKPDTFTNLSDKERALVEDKIAKVATEFSSKISALFSPKS